MWDVVWGWNGTLFDDLEIVVASVNVSVRATGAPPIEVEAYRAVYQRPLHRFYENLLGRPVRPEEMASIDDDFHAAYHALLDQARLTGDAGRAGGGGCHRRRPRRCRRRPGGGGGMRAIRWRVPTAGGAGGHGGAGGRHAGGGGGDGGGVYLGLTLCPD